MKLEDLFEDWKQERLKGCKCKGPGARNVNPKCPIHGVEEVNEAKGGFKLYTEHPYGAGFMDTPVTKGELLPTEDGDAVTFVGISADGKKIKVKHDGEAKEVSPKEVMGIILPADESVKGRKDFVEMDGQVY